MNNETKKNSKGQTLAIKISFSYKFSFLFYFFFGRLTQELALAQAEASAKDADLAQIRSDHENHVEVANGTIDNKQLELSEIQRELDLTHRNVERLEVGHVVVVVIIIINCPFLYCLFI